MKKMLLERSLWSGECFFFDAVAIRVRTRYGSKVRGMRNKCVAKWIGSANRNELPHPLAWRYESNAKWIPAIDRVIRQPLSTLLGNRGAGNWNSVMPAARTNQVKPPKANNSMRTLEGEGTCRGKPFLLQSWISDELGKPTSSYRWTTLRAPSSGARIDVGSGWSIVFDFFFNSRKTSDARSLFAAR